MARVQKVTSFYGSELPRPFVVLQVDKDGDGGVTVVKDRVDEPKANASLIGEIMTPAGVCSQHSHDIACSII